MKKKLFVSLLIFAISLSCVSAYAAGKISVTQENFQTTESFWRFSYAYAKVENIGDKPIKINGGILEIYDENGDVITSDDYIESTCEFLQPGEYTYAKMYVEIEEGQPDPDDYLLTMTGKSDNSVIDKRLPATAEYKPDVDEYFWKTDYMYATFTNDTEDVVYGIEIVFALLDENGNILSVEHDYLGSDVGVNPGSTITMRKEVDSTIKEASEKMGLVASSVDAIVYYEIDNPEAD